MKNLKKVLALVMAFAMAFTMMAGAAYTDQADITATEAVDTLAALNIMTGDTDGSFRPNDTVTRAEMCRMIYSIRNQGKSDASAYAKMQTTFTDVGESAWFSGYVKYCQSVGIVSGRSKTIFDPNAKVTGVEAALMCLRVMGYDPAKAGIGGSSWSMTTIGLADENGLLDDVNCTLTTDLPRQYAAQIMFNMIDAPTVKWSTDSDSYSDVGSDNTPNETVGHKYLDLNKVVATLTSVKKTDGKDTYELTLDKDTINEDESDSKVTNFREVKTDYNNLKYKTVKVLFKKANEVYGVFATEDNTASTGVLADLKMDGEKVKLDGTKYDLAKDTSVYVDGEKVTDKATDTIKEWVTANAEGKLGGKGSTVELVANDGSSNIAILNVTTYTVKEVTYVGSDYVTAGIKYEEDDYVISEGIKKNDFVMISKAGNYSDDKGRVEKAEVVEGKVTSTKGDDKVMIDGTWYTMDENVTAPKLNASAKLVIVNGYVYKVDAAGGTSDVALLVEMGNNNNVGSKYYQARLILADGTDKVVDIEKHYGDVDETPINPKSDFAAHKNKLVTYDVSKDVYTLTLITTNSKAGEMAGYENFYSVDNATVDGSIRGGNWSNATGNAVNNPGRAYFYDDATVFVQYKTDDYKVVTGKAAKAWDSATANTIRMVTEKDGNSQYVGAAYVDLGAKNVPGGSDKTYAVALDSSYTSKIDGTTYTVVKAWNGSEETEYKYEGTLSNGIAKGDVFEYSSNGDGTVDIDKLTATTTQVKTYDVGSGEITFADSVANLNDNNSKIDSKDTAVLYVDSDAAKGETDGEIQLAPEFNGDANNHDDNVTVYVDAGDDCITLIVVDVQNKMKW